MKPTLIKIIAVTLVTMLFAVSSMFWLAGYGGNSCDVPGKSCDCFCCGMFGLRGYESCGDFGLITGGLAGLVFALLLINGRRRESFKNIGLPVAVFLYLPFTFYVYLVVWGGAIDMYRNDAFLTPANVMQVSIASLIWPAVTWILFKSVVRLMKKDRRNWLLIAVPLVFFVGTYLLNGYVNNRISFTRFSGVDNGQSVQGWKTYHDHDFGFEIKYPPYLSISNQGRGEYSTAPYFGQPGATNEYTIILSDPRATSTVTDYFGARVTFYYPYDEQSAKPVLPDEHSEELIIDGVTFTHLYWTQKGVNLTADHDVFIAKLASGWAVRVDNPIGYYYKPEFKDILRELAKSLKLPKTVSVATTTVKYVNKVNGFSFDYPADWVLSGSPGNRTVVVSCSKDMTNTCGKHDMIRFDYLGKVNSSLRGLTELHWAESKSKGVKGQIQEFLFDGKKLYGFSVDQEYCSNVVKGKECQGGYLLDVAMIFLYFENSAKEKFAVSLPADSSKAYGILRTLELY